jgi:hypothetical protein
MAKVEIRIPTDTYAYINLQYESMEEYIKNYPGDRVSVNQTRLNTQKRIEQWKEANKHDEIPFTGKEYAKK